MVRILMKEELAYIIQVHSMHMGIHPKNRMGKKMQPTVPDRFSGRAGSSGLGTSNDGHAAPSGSGQSDNTGTDGQSKG